MQNIKLSHNHFFLNVLLLLCCCSPRVVNCWPYFQQYCELCFFYISSTTHRDSFKVFDLSVIFLLHYILELFTTMVISYFADQDVICKHYGIAIFISKVSEYFFHRCPPDYIMRNNLCNWNLIEIGNTTVLMKDIRASLNWFKSTVRMTIAANFINYVRLVGDYYTSKKCDGILISDELCIS